MTEPLDESTLRTALGPLEGWDGDTHEIARTVQMSTFRAAIDVVDRVADAAEEMDHHPDIDIRYSTLTFHCATHSVGGVTESDLTLAQRINGIVAELA